MLANEQDSHKKKGSAEAKGTDKGADLEDPTNGGDSLLLAESDESEDSEDDLLLPFSAEETLARSRQYVAYTVKLPSEQLAALQSIWLELKKLYGTHSPDKSGMIHQAVSEWLRDWDGPEKKRLLRELLEIRANTRKRQFKK